MPIPNIFSTFLIKFDGFVKSPDAALRFILRHCGVRKSTPHSSGFARLACGAFYEAARLGKFFNFLRAHQFHFSIYGFRGLSTVFQAVEPLNSLPFRFIYGTSEILLEAENSPGGGSLCPEKQAL